MAKAQPSFVELITQPGVTYKGWLMKQGGAHRFEVEKKMPNFTMKTWKRRLFVLKDEVLYYYKAEEAKEPQGVFELNRELLTLNEVDPRAGFENCFEIFNGLNTLCLAAETRLEMVRWVSSIHSMMKQKSTQRKASMVSVDDSDIYPSTGGSSYYTKPLNPARRSQPLTASSTLSYAMNANGTLPNEEKDVLQPLSPVGMNRRGSGAASRPGSFSRGCSLIVPQRKGHLFKQGGRVKSWKRRLFVLEGTRLVYYKGEIEDNMPVGVIDLRMCRAVAECTEKNIEFCFALSTLSRTYVFSASDQASLQSWIADLTVAIEAALSVDVEAQELFRANSRLSARPATSFSTSLRPSFKSSQEFEFEDEEDDEPMTAQERLENAAGTLFRSNSVATRIINGFCKMIIGKYLVSTLQAAIAEICTTDLTSEIDPARLAPGSTLEEGKANLAYVADLLLTAIVESADNAPQHLKYVCGMLREEVAKKFPSNIVERASTGFLMLRIFSPVIVQPALYGLVKPSQTSQRSLILATKLLQTMANGAESGMKEDFMSVISSFTVYNYERLQMFTNEMSKETIPEYSVGPGEEDDGRDKDPPYPFECKPLEDVTPESAPEIIFNHLRRLAGYLKAELNGLAEVDALVLGDYRRQMRRVEMAAGQSAAVLSSLLLERDMRTVSDLCDAAPADELDQLCNALVVFFHHERAALRLVRWSLQKEVSCTDRAFKNRFGQGQGGVVKKGWLSKQGSRGMIARNFRRRWFVLSPTGVLEYFTNETQTDRMGVIPLARCSSVNLPGGDDLRLELVAPGRTYVLQCELPEDRPAWAQAVTPYLLNHSIGTKEGYMYKQGEKKSNWKRRYFQLVGTELRYFAKPPDQDSKEPMLGSVDLCLCENVLMSTTSGSNHEFYLVLPGRTYPLRVDSEDDLNSWLGAIGSRLAM